MNHNIRHLSTKHGQSIVILCKLPTVLVVYENHPKTSLINFEKKPI